LARLTEAGIANFRTPEACADAIAAAFARRRPRVVASHILRIPSQTRLLDELAGYDLLDRIGVRHARCVAIGADAHLLPSDLRYPVAVKVLSTKIAHKTDVGGVVLGVRNRAELEAAIERVRTEVARHCTDSVVDRILVQEMASGIGEALIGYRQDVQAGPIVMVAAGGTLTEIYRDRALRLAPVDLATAREMIDQVKALRAFAGYRGAEAGDLEALAQAIVSVSQLGALTDPVVIEAEMNPMIIGATSEGVVAVDALVRVG
jgi:acyl-CoA synthetase (NDP forming)